MFRVKTKIIAAGLFIFAFSANGKAQVAQNKICPAPSKPCTDAKIKFEPQQLSFKIVKRGNTDKGEPLAVSASFFAIILKSMKSNASNPNCSSHFSEKERLEAQALFPDNKVFASRYECGGESSFLYFDENLKDANLENNLLAVYGGETKAQAEQMLKKVKAIKAFSGANLRKMHVQVGLAFD